MRKGGRATGDESVSSLDRLGACFTVEDNQMDEPHQAVVKKVGRPGLPQARLEFWNPLQIDSLEPLLGRNSTNTLRRRNLNGIMKTNSHPLSNLQHNLLRLSSCPIPYLFYRHQCLGFFFA